MIDLLDTLAMAGIVLRVDSGQLRYTAPAGALTPALRGRIVDHKGELLALLAGAGCPRCGQPAPAAGAWCDACLDATWPASGRLVTRRPITIEWTAVRGWLRVRDPFTGEWHEIAAKDAPRCWLDQLRKDRTATTTRTEDSHDRYHA